MKILVTGATGQLGAKVVEALLAKVPAEQLAVSVRDPEKASALSAQGVDVRRGDFEDPASLDTAFAGVERLLIVSTQGDNDTRIRQHLAAVAVAQRAGVQLIAYTSVVNAAHNSLELAPVHKATEEAIAKTGIPYVFLRNNWYIENETGTIQGILAGAPLVTSAGEGKVGWDTREDYAQAAAAVLTGNGHENKIYELSGTPIPHAELARIIGEALGREVPVQHVDDATYAEVMRGAGVPEPVVPFLVSIQRSIREGALDVPSGDLETLLGRPATPLVEAVRDIVKDLQA
ncbi:SDR family oxidoreductase [Paenibacillus sp. DXFW5]|uniref:SDR family oxidoreductase n=1 Tax=Paenibacillus rhizolycopersici TaxID=2780073 RepID=A0ABS2H1S9_9BACL|nr:SDR family oxidoreductase [Paenibacillus rhizolycopersici]MBM6994541.1 SDR family oxidoreductase [Paenibacillus rhizolycopersici]